MVASSDVCSMRKSREFGGGGTAAYYVQYYYSTGVWLETLFNRNKHKIIVVGIVVSSQSRTLDKYQKDQNFVSHSHVLLFHAM